MMKCEDMQVLLNADTLDSMAIDHLEKCSECQQYKSDIEAILKSSNTFKTSEELDSKILAFASQNRPFLNKPAVKQVIPFYVWGAIATAAIIVLAFVLLKDGGLLGQSNGGDVVKEEKKQKVLPEDISEMANKNSEKQDAVMELWEDDLLDVEMSALEGELFVLSNELE